MAINNLQAFHGAMASLAPIVGVSGDGTIFFDTSATPAQIAAANAAAASYTDVAPQVCPLSLALSRMTDTEYQAMFTLANTNVAVHRLLHIAQTNDYSFGPSHALLQLLITNNVLTAARAAVVFAAPPTPPPSTIAALPTSGSIFSHPTPIGS